MNATRRTTYLLLASVCTVGLLLAYVKDPFHLFTAKEKGLIPKATAITKMVIKTGETSETILEKKQEQWIVASLEAIPADPTTIQDMLTTVSTATLPNPISTNKESHAQLGVGDDGTRVQLYNGETLVRELLIGRTGPDLQSTFVRLAGSDAVYQVSGNLSTSFMKGEYRDLTVWTIPQTEVSKIRGSFAGATVTIEKKEEEKWSVTEPLTLELTADRSTTVLTRISSITATDIAPAGDQKDLTETGSLLISLKDNKTKTLTLYSKVGSEDTIAIQSEAPYWYTLSPETVKQLPLRLSHVDSNSPLPE